MELPYALYRRVSGDEQAKDGISLEHQANKMALYAELKELRPTLEITDDGYSAKDAKRPGMIRLLELMRKREVRGVVIYKLDRLTRSLRDWSNWIDEFFGEKGKIQLYSVQDEINTTTAAGRLGLNILMSVAQWEREVNSERTKDNLATHIGKGHRAGKLRFGHTLNPTGPLSRRKRPVQLLDDPVQQAAIAMMKALRQEGASLRAIAAALDAAGIPTAEGKGPWQSSSVSRILKRCS